MEKSFALLDFKSLDVVQCLDFTALEEVARKWHWKHVIVAHAFTLDSLKAAQDKVKQFSTRFMLCHLMLKPDENEFKRMQGKADFVGVYGKSIANNQFAVQHETDFWFMPVSSGKPELDLASCHVAKENGVHAGIVFNEFLGAPPELLAAWMRNYAFAVGLLDKAQVPVHVFSGAKTPADLRAPYDLNALLLVLRGKDFTESVEEGEEDG